MLTIFLSAAAFAIDVANWYLNAERLQRSADAAALGSSVYLPEDPDRARVRADDIVQENGMQSAAIDAHPSPTNPNRMYVKVGKDVTSVFGQVLGLKTLHIARDAEAEYSPPIAMGSPSNVLGVEPPGDVWQNPATAALQGNYWLTIHGPETSKYDGARWTAGGCSGPTTPEECDRSRPTPGENTVWAPDGQRYVVHVPMGMTGTLRLEAYDAAYVHTDLHCSDDMANAEPLDPVRYARNDSPYCAGDTTSNGGAPMTTSYTLRFPDNSPISPGGVVTGCPTSTFQGFDGDIGNEIIANPTGDVAKTFHRWTSICTINLDAIGGGDYVLHVGQGTSGFGENQFALRAGVFNSVGVLDTVSSNQVTVSSDSRLELLTTSSQTASIFYLAKVRPTFAGRTITTELYSIGDDIPADVTILPPLEATVNGVPITSFTSCTRTRPGETTSINAPNCTYPRASDRTSGQEPGFVGKHGNINVLVPEGFSCDQISPSGCWMRISMTRVRSGQIQDTTSWHTYVNAQMVRLTE
jgi:hypothetical protein